MQILVSRLIPAQPKGKRSLYTRRVTIRLLMTDLLLLSLTFILTSTNDRETATGLFLKNKITTLAKNHIPKKQFRSSDRNPGLPTHLKDWKIKKTFFFRAAKHTSSSWQKYCGAGSDYVFAIQEAKYKLFNRDLARMVGNNSRRLWQAINPYQRRRITLGSHNAEVVPDAEWTDLFNTAFSSVFTEASDVPCLLVLKVLLPVCPLLFFLQMGIVGLIQNCKPAS